MIVTDRAGTAVTIRPARGRSGMSLLEVLLALTIFLIALAAIASLVDVGATRGLDAVLQSTGTRLAQSKLAEVEAGVIPVTAPQNGIFEEEPEWNWSVETAPAGIANVYTVTVRVWKELSNRRFEIVLAQMILDPAMMGTAAEAQNPNTATSSDSTSTASGGSGS